MTRFRLQSVIVIVACVSVANPVIAGRNDRRLADTAEAAGAMMTGRPAPAIGVDPQHQRPERNDG